MIEVANLENGKLQRVQEIIPWTPGFSSEDSWSGVCLEQGGAPPAEAPENTCTKHLVWMHIGPATRFENHVPGRSWRAHTLLSQSLLFIPAGTPVRGQWRDPVASLGIQIEPELLSSAAGDDDALRFRLREGYSSGDPFIAQILQAMRRDFREGLPSGRLYGDTLANALVAHLVRHHALEGHLEAPPSGGLPPHRLRRVVDYIHEHVGKDLSIHELAALVDLNQAHFARAFRRTTGLSPYHYVVLQRIERACELLENLRLSIGEIATQCGFSSQSSFTTTFGRIKGITPGAYRNAISPSLPS
jgi:AraC family transcriptional regulator